MNLERIIDIIENQSQIYESDLELIKKVHSQFPYTSIFPMLLLKGLKDSKHIDFESKLKQLSIQVQDRERLEKYLETEPNQIEKEEVETGLVLPEIEESTEEITKKESHIQLESTEQTIETSAEEALPKTDEIQEEIEKGEQTISETEEEQKLEASNVEEFAESVTELESKVVTEENQQKKSTSSIHKEEKKKKKKHKKPKKKLKEKLKKQKSDSPFKFKEFKGEDEEYYHLEIDFSDLEPLTNQEEAPFSEEKESVETKEKNEIQEEQFKTITEESTFEEPFKISVNSKSEMTFLDWLKANKKDPTRDKHKKTNKSEKEEKIIETFIESKPSIGPIKKEFFSPTKNAKKSLEDDLEIVSETLAELHVFQGSYSKAKKIYNQLILKFPEKKSLFAQKLREITQLQKKNLS